MSKSKAETQEYTFGSALLIPEHPIAFSPTLACVIGDRQAIAIQQIHYWLDINRKAKKRDTHFRDGRWWTYNTYAEWEGSFPFWSRRTIRRMINELEEKGLLLSEQFGARKGDQTKWYTVDYDLLDLYLEQREKAETPVNTEVAKLDTHESILDSHLANLASQEDKVDNSLQRDLHRLHPETSSETSVYVKASGNADTGKTQFENGLANDVKGSSDNGTVSGKNQIQDKGVRENDSHSQNETDLYATPWNPKTEAFREDDRGWAVMPPANKHKLIRFMTTRAMQLELLELLDDEFSAEWNEDESKLWITTTHALTGWEEDVLGTVESVGANWVEYDNEDDDYCHPGNASLRVLRDWGYQRDAIGQTWYNDRLKELWDASTDFCKRHGDQAKEILDSNPLWECIYIDIELDDE